MQTSKKAARSAPPSTIIPQLVDGAIRAIGSSQKEQISFTHNDSKFTLSVSCDIADLMKKGDILIEKKQWPAVIEIFCDILVSIETQSTKLSFSWNYVTSLENFIFYCINQLISALEASNTLTTTTQPLMICELLLAKKAKSMAALLQMRLGEKYQHLKDPINTKRFAQLGKESALTTSDPVLIFYARFLLGFSAWKYAQFAAAIENLEAAAENLCEISTLMSADTFLDEFLCIQAMIVIVKKQLDVKPKNSKTDTTNTSINDIKNHCQQLLTDPKYYIAHAKKMLDKKLAHSAAILMEKAIQLHESNPEKYPLSLVELFNHYNEYAIALCQIRSSLKLSDKSSLICITDISRKIKNSYLKRLAKLDKSKENIAHQLLRAELFIGLYELTIYSSSKAALKQYMADACAILNETLKKEPQNLQALEYLARAKRAQQDQSPEVINKTLKQWKANFKRLNLPRQDFYTILSHLNENPIPTEDTDKKSTVPPKTPLPPSPAAPAKTAVKKESHKHIQQQAARLQMHTNFGIAIAAGNKLMTAIKSALGDLENDFLKLPQPANPDTWLVKPCAARAALDAELNNPIYHIDETKLSHAIESGRGHSLLQQLQKSNATFTETLSQLESKKQAMAATLQRQREIKHAATMPLPAPAPIPKNKSSSALKEKICQSLAKFHRNKFKSIVSEFTDKDTNPVDYYAGLYHVMRYIWAHEKRPSAAVEARPLHLFLLTHDNINFREFISDAPTFPHLDLKQTQLYAQCMDQDAKSSATDLDTIFHLLNNIIDEIELAGIDYSKPKLLVLPTPSLIPPPRRSIESLTPFLRAFHETEMDALMMLSIKCGDFFERECKGATEEVLTKKYDQNQLSFLKFCRAIYRHAATAEPLDATLLRAIKKFKECKKYQQADLSVRTCLLGNSIFSKTVANPPPAEISAAMTAAVSSQP